MDVVIDLRPSRPETTGLVTRGAARFLVSLGYAPLAEVTLPNGRRAIGSLDSELWNVARRHRHRPLVAQRNNTNGQIVEWNSWSVGGACGRDGVRIPVVRPETIQRGGFHMAIGTTDIHPAVPQRHCATSHPHC